MNNQEAKIILQGYRPGGQDAADPLFAEALEQVRRDPALQKWFAQEQTFDMRMQAKLAEAIPIPLGLKARLLAQRKMVPAVPWWRHFNWLTAAATAALVLFAAVAGLWLKPAAQSPLADFRSAMVKYSLQKSDHLNFQASDLTKIQAWLKEQNIAADFDLPAALRAAPVHGCKVVDWRGHRAALLCFLPQGGGHVDLFVLDSTPFRDFTPSATTQFARHDGTATAVWSSGGKTYLLASHGGSQQELMKLL